MDIDRAVDRAENRAHLFLHLDEERLDDGERQRSDLNTGLRRYLRRLDVSVTRLDLARRPCRRRGRVSDPAVSPARDAGGVRIEARRRLCV